jgi:hypothetical protein
MEKRNISLETHLALLDFERAFDMVKGTSLFKLLTKINIPKLILQNKV